MEIAVAVVETPENNIELYISVGEEGPSHSPLPIHRETVPSHERCHEGGTSYVGACGNDSNNVEAVQDQSVINLNTVPEYSR